MGEEKVIDGYVVLKGWYPIASAPKDGSKIGFHHQVPGKPFEAFGGVTRWADGEWQPARMMRRFPAPTHWRPLEHAR